MGLGDLSKSDLEAALKTVPVSSVVVAVVLVVATAAVEVVEAVVVV